MVNNTNYEYEIAFIIVTYNSELDILKCLQSIIQCSPDSLKYKIIVIDNNSSDSTTDIVCNMKRENEQIHLIESNKNLGFGVANNLGFSHVNSEYYFLLNADAWLISASSILPIIEKLRVNPRIAICGLPLIYPDGFPQTYTYAFSSWDRWLLQIFGIKNIVLLLIKYPWICSFLEKFSYGKEFLSSQKRTKIDFDKYKKIHVSNELRNVDWVCGAAMVISDNFLKQVGGFDKDIFLYGEDEDLCITAHQNKWEVSVIDTVPIVHKFGWGGNKFNMKVSDLKYKSLQYFINKNIKNIFSKYCMKLILPIYVYGWKYAYKKIYFQNKLKDK